MNINWDEAPEGTTHAIKFNKSLWRKVVGDDVYAWDYKGNQWSERPFSLADKWLKSLKDGVVERPAPEIKLVDGFIPWHGGEPPVADNVRVEYRMRGQLNRHHRDVAGMLRWGHLGTGGDIISWRLAEPKANDAVKPKEQPIKVENFGIGVAQLQQVKPKPSEVAPKKPIGWWT